MNKHHGGAELGKGGKPAKKPGLRGVAKPLGTPAPSAVADARGGPRLVVDGTRHITGLVEALHGQILRIAPPLLLRPDSTKLGAVGSGTGAFGPMFGPADGEGDGLPPTRGLTGLIYRSIQGSTRRVGDGLDGLLAPFDGVLGDGDAGRPASPRRDALVAALNGVLGDHLLRSGNPLATPMQLRQNGQPLNLARLRTEKNTGRVLLLVHGLCMSDLGWCRSGHDHGQALGRALGATPVYACYNSGLHISQNGRALAEQLEALVPDWPLPLNELMIVGHSMGGLVARSAIAIAQQAGHRWPKLLGKLVFLGTPHHGAPLERAGNWLHRVMDLSPYVAPFTRLSRLRSAGITDLRHGNLLDAHWQGASRFDHRDHRTPVPLPAGVVCFALASTVGGRNSAGALLGNLSGDGLVPVHSALGRHKNADFDLGLPESHTWLGHGISHLDLLSDPVVYRRLLAWLGD